MADTNGTQLEKALRVAATEPGQRPEFYKLLLESPVYILAHSSDPSEGRKVLTEGSKVSIQHWAWKDGSHVIPFFTSLEALQRSIETQTNYMELSARSLFEMTKGATLVLNPKSPYGKEFLPDEIEALLSDGVNRRASQRVTTEETRVLLGQPAKYPTRMVDSLTDLLSRRRNVKAAYLALMHDPSQDDKPHLLVGIEAEGDFEQVIREAGVVVADTAGDGEPVDLVRVERGHRGLSDYFVREVKPFYRRSWGGTLKSLFGGRS